MKTNQTVQPELSLCWVHNDFVGFVVFCRLWIVLVVIVNKRAAA